MPTTPGGLPYPSSTDSANVPSDLLALANAVEAAYLKAATAASTYLSLSAAASTYLTQATATSTYAPLVNAPLVSPIFTSPEETVTISATAATGTIAFDAATQGVLYYTTNASANWTLNVRASGAATLNSVLSTGQSITVAFLVTNGATAYYQTGFQVDGSAVTPKWIGGAAPTSGNANSIDIYTATIIKTGAATFTVIEGITRAA